MTAQPPEPSAAELAFADFLERVEAGERPDFDAFCAERVGLEPALRRMHVRWTAVARAFESVGGNAAASGGHAGDGGLASLVRQSRGDAGRLGRYSIAGEIARGGMGRIVRAFDLELRREVALKMLHGEPADARRQRRFLEEAQIAAQLDHPGVVPIHELGVDAAGRPFFSMQLVRGQDLGAILQRAAAGDAEWTRARVLGVLLRVCEAVAFAHERGVVHRDLKPANVMVGRFGETYVMDWGLARVLGATEEEAARSNDSAIDTVRRDVEDSGAADALLTRDGDIVGTPAYMAPEQAAGRAEAGPTVDVYAVGAMLYHLLSGSAPYCEDGTREPDVVLQRVRERAPPPLSQAVPAELRAICEQAMARAPERRYPTMAALADDLRAFLEVRTVRAYATGRFAELRKWVTRNRAIAIAAAALVASLAVGAAAVTGLWIEADRSRATADTASSRLRRELELSTFRNARQSLSSENSREAGDALWRIHLSDTMPRASLWSLHELAERDPYLVSLPFVEDGRPVATCPELGAVLVGGSDGRLQVRDDVTLAIRHQIGEPTAALTSLAVLPGTTTAVAGTSDGLLRRFDLMSGRVTGERQAHQGSVRRLVVARGAAFASGGADGVVTWWPDFDDEPRQLIRFDRGVTSLAMRPSCDGVAAGDEAGHVVARAIDASWNVDLRIGSRIASLAFGAHQNELWIGSTDHQLRRFDFLDRERSLTMPTRNGTCRQLARDEDGSLLAGGWWRIDRLGTDGMGRGSVSLRGVSRWSLDAARRRMVTCGEVHGLGVLDLSSADRRVLRGAGAIALSGDGRRYATVVDDQAVVHDVDTGAQIRRLPPGSAGNLKLDRTGSMLFVTNGKPARVHAYAVDTGAHLITLPGPGDDPVADCIAVAPTGDEAAFVVGADRIVRRARDGTELGEIGCSGTVIRIAYSGNGSRLAAIARRSNRVQVHDLATGTAIEHAFTDSSLDGGATMLSAVALSPDGSRLAVGTWQGTVLLRATDEPDAATTAIPAHAGTVWSLAFSSADPGLLITSGGAQGVTMWDLDTNERCYETVRDVATRVQVSDDGRTLACLVPEGALLLDLSYRRRHIAGTLEHRLARLAGSVELPPDRAAALRAWAASVLAEPWPRWR